jgi:hypothetical protein
MALPSPCSRAASTLAETANPGNCRTIRIVLLGRRTGDDDICRTESGA